MELAPTTELNLTPATILRFNPIFDLVWKVLTLSNISIHSFLIMQTFLCCSVSHPHVISISIFLCDIGAVKWEQRRAAGAECEQPKEQVMRLVSLLQRITPRLYNHYTASHPGHSLWKSLGMDYLYELYMMKGKTIRIIPAAFFAFSD